MKPPRRTHKNRFSLTHISTDTTATLPEYVPASQNVFIQRQQPTRPRMLDPELEGLLPTDQPPGYPDSADEADEETDSATGGEAAYYHASSLPATPSPRRRHGTRLLPSINLSDQHYAHPYRHHQVPPSHFHHQSTTPHHRRLKSYASPTPTDDPYLDSLLERSVHALEMSNTLLQSSISTQASLSALLKTPSMEAEGERERDRLDRFEERAKGLTKRIDVHGERREQWVDDLEKIKKDVERLFPDDRWEGSSRAAIDFDSGLGGVSCSLPTSSSMPALRAHKRRPSQLNLRHPAQDSEAPRLTYSSQYRSRLIAPAPRAVTQYIAVPSADSGTITLPSTLGMRTWSTFLNHPSASASTPSFHSSPLSPQVTDKLPQPTTPAYTMLASFVHQTPGETSSTPASFTAPSVLSSRASSSVPTTSSAGKNSDGPAFQSTRRSSRDNLRSLPSTRTSSADRSRGRSPRSPLIHRTMTPPTEESAGSSSSSESLIAKQTVMCLRKILDDQPPPARSTVSLDTQGKKRLRAPAFMPFTPVPVPQASTSNATASVSRLFTKAIHTSSTRPPSPPRQSALKHGSGSRSSISGMGQIQLPSTSVPSGPPRDIVGGSNDTIARLTNLNVMKTAAGTLPELLSAGVAKALGSAKASVLNSPSSSGRSTPKRISFAELPDVERPEGRSSRFKEKQAQRKRRRSKGMSMLSGNRNGEGGVYGDGRRSSTADGLENGSPPIGDGWWSGWLGDANDGGIGGALAGMGSGTGGMYVSRLEERSSKPWSGAERPGFGFADWAV